MIPEPDSLLVVDDDALNRNLMTQRLSGCGFNVSAVDCGEAALSWIETNPVDLMLLDIEMPGISGIQVLKHLREKYTAAQLPIIMVTGRANSEDIVEALNLGANDHIAKPIDFAVVLARIQTQLSRKHAEQALRESEERYALAALGANDGLWYWDLAADKIYFSPRWKSMLGWEEDEISESPEEWFQRIHPEDVDRVRTDIAAHIQELTPNYDDEYRILHRDGSYLWMHGRGIAVRNGYGKVYRMAGSQTDITREKVVDVLTGLPNRVLFMDRLGRSFERARRSKNKSFALIFLGLDSFKLVNDSLGHLIGDQMLVAIAGRIEATVRSCDTVARIEQHHTVARLGGDEFTVLLDDVSSTLDATRVAERILQALSEPFTVDSHEIFPTASIGIAMHTSAYQSAEELLRDANTAMHSAKALGKGHYEIFDANMRANTIARLQLETELRRGIERKEFELHYQPLVALETGKILGFEALVRWQHPNRGMVPPNEFIPIAEETGIIVPLGQWVLETACQQARIWQARFADDTPLSINVNLSAKQFLQPDLVQQCRTILFETQLLQSSLTLEVTESAMIQNPETAIEVMRQLKSFGIKLALDDFGTGYSSLSYLHRFPLDSLKIDRSFISRMSEDYEIVRTIISLGRNLGLKVIAEGVETKEQAEKLRDLGCEFVQGFYFSIPVDAREATDLLAAKRSWPIPLQITIPGTWSAIAG